MLNTIRTVLRCIYGIFVVFLMLFGLFLVELHIPFHIVQLMFDIEFIMKWIKIPYVFYGFSYLALILEYLCGIKINVYISPPTYHFLNEFKTSKKPGAILMSMNHRARVDWMMIWCVLTRFEVIQNLIIISRKLLQYVPIIGWCFVWIGIFLERNWNTDEPMLSAMIKVLGSTLVEPKSIFLFFAEGTDLWYKAIASSDSFADKYNLPKYKYVLHPRTTGFVKIIHELNDNLYAIMDATIGYIDYVEGERCNELTLAQGRYCKEVYFYFETFTVDDIIKQYKQHYNYNNNNNNDDDDELNEFNIKSFINKPFYKPSGYKKKEERQKYIDCIDNDKKEEIEIIDNAIRDFVRKSFEKKEIRLKEWYENGRWIDDEKYKIKYSFIPRSTYFIAMIIFLLHLIGFIWLWRNMRWYIYLCCIVNTIFAVSDTVGKIIRSYRPWIVKMEKQRKQKRKQS